MTNLPVAMIVGRFSATVRNQRAVSLPLTSLVDHWASASNPFGIATHCDLVEYSKSMENDVR